MELSKEKILEWALDYASYEELEETAKALYAVYTSRRRTEKPELEAKAKQYKKEHNITRSNWKKKKKSKKTSSQIKLY